MLINRGPSGYFIGGVACVGVAVYALVTGEIPGRHDGAAILRAASPREFWFFVALLSAFGVGCFVWAFHLMGRNDA
jgi:hypothetical protein